MTIKDCVKTAARFLDLDELIKKLSDDGFSGGGDDSELIDFLDMARDVIAEICRDYYPLKITEKAKADKDGVISLYSLNKPVIDIFKVSYSGMSIPFTVKYDRLEIGFGGECAVEYSYMPDLSNYDVTLPFTDRIGLTVIAYGIAAEYALINSPEDAPLYDSLYKNALKKAVSHKGEKRVKGRRWL